MANSKYEYVKDFEVNDNILPHTWIVIRIDGRAFTKFSQAHQFQKPNDLQALLLMNASAVAVVEDLADVVFAYGVSDEYSFVLRKTSTLYQRRASKLISVICSLFASSYVMNWGKYFPETKLQYAPAFDGRAVCYPSESILRDYLSWRQVDCHINNQYNTCFWNLVGSGKSTAESQNMLKGTTADVKNNLLFDTFKINYNDLPQIFRKGSIVYRKKVEKVVKVEDGQEIKRLRSCAVVEHEDIIRDNFWTQYPYILGGK
ncbi:tRNA(His) guanylyltransferase 2 isoform X1 [Physcomitrium patens]|uniref:tRNA(His) guanylyltransferase n=2 Tax=Physcomitrium patens TaxID=3218 RepID=A9SZ11_PHYPA|nr:tRNA(His) guanylyltransferase 1-like isoform X1 [Physcomitrium patens]XP_024380973.1 tRNA(His) guanylyltransferase 1-like isoform X1 [Physcomitrium patens]XP_024380983.1 tRNA(His) guanylyltransferase 1-like isoform X1 [Physcomitrium patens]PNR62078.1 hypothetical protein PHYPA_000502 [Physcomitrium patens]|eukprot:XP_024380966.1 tRNA(His) guanylyltransferase 1-like isoform X1 [Physcomitrella patens]